MKKIILLLALGCVLKPLEPLPPIGCDRLKAVCICHSTGDCHWEWICVDDFNENGEEG